MSDFAKEAEAQQRSHVRAEKDAKRQRLIECARKDPEMSSTMLAERFSVSRSCVTEWLREAGVVVARHEMMGAYSDSSRRMKGFRQRQKARRAAQ